MTPITTPAAAERLGITRDNLLMIIHRNPELKPAAKLPSGRRGVYIWTEAEIEVVRQFLSNRNKQGDTREGKDK